MIDWARVQELRDDIGPGAFSQVTDMFLVEIGDVIDRLRGQADPGQLEMDLHFLKGGVLNLGFTQVATLCQRGEAMAAQGDAAHVDTAEILRAYDAAQQVFIAELPLRFGP